MRKILDYLFDRISIKAYQVKKNKSRWSKMGDRVYRGVFYLEKMISQRFKPEVNEKSIVLMKTNNSGSNTLALFKKAPHWIQEKYELKVVNYRFPIDYKTYVSLRHARVVCQTHEYFMWARPNAQIGIQLWHGLPMKSAGLMSNRLTNNYKRLMIKQQNKFHKGGADYHFISSSGLFNTVLNASFPIGRDRFEILGNPRNDLLFDAPQTDFFAETLAIPKDNTVVIFMPTWRKSYKSSKRVDGAKSMINPFGMEQADYASFLSFLEQNKIVIVAKLHPYEEEFFVDVFSQSDNLKILTDAMLNEADIDLYQLLSMTDILVTDYSSIYFDYLLLDKPVIFTPVDLNDYDQNLGFVLTPYNEWTPGIKAVDFKELENAIISSINKPEQFYEDRKRVLNMTHYHQDGLSSERFWHWLDEELSH